MSSQACRIRADQEGETARPSGTNERKHLQHARQGSLGRPWLGTGAWHLLRARTSSRGCPMCLVDAKHMDSERKNAISDVGNDILDNRAHKSLVRSILTTAIRSSFAGRKCSSTQPPSGQLPNSLLHAHQSQACRNRGVKEIGIRN